MHTIQTRLHTYFTGKTNDGKQVLLGWVRDVIAVVLFDTAGNVLETREYPLNIDLKKGLGPAAEEIADKNIYFIINKLGLRKGPIQVKQFFIERWNIGLKQFPLDLEDFLDRPDAFPEEDAQLFNKDIKDWKNDGNCVLQWGDDYHLGCDGHTL